MNTIPGYEFKSLLGQGGMARVYLATQNSLSRSVAIKVLNATLTQDPEIQTRFKQESQIIARLNHQNIIQVIDQGTTNEGLPYFIMPYVKSIPLDAIIKREDISLMRKLSVFIQICGALAYAHRNNVIHRDIKPSNVLVDYEGQAKLIDFGIAGYFNANNKVTEDENFSMGTEAYTAPEQRNGAATHLSDIYSLGVLMHHIVYGVLPFQHDFFGSKNRLNDEPSQISEKIQTIIDACLQPAPDQRPQRAETVRQQLLLLSRGKHLRSTPWKNETPHEQLPPNYTILDVIKESPFGTTYLVTDNNRNRLMIVKKQNIQHVGRAQIYAEKLKIEPESDFVRIYGTAKNKRVFVLISEYCTFGSLNDRLSQSLSLGDAVDIAQQLCKAVISAHKHNLIHGNIRPSNIVFSHAMKLKLCDFGFPVHTYATPSHCYCIPKEPLTPLSDIYSIGVVIFELLTAKQITQGYWGLKNWFALRKTPKPIAKTVLKMLKKKPKRRLQDLSYALNVFQQTQNQAHTSVLARSVITASNQ